MLYFSRFILLEGFQVCLFFSPTTRNLYDFSCYNKQKGRKKRFFLEPNELKITFLSTFEGIEEKETIQRFKITVRHHISIVQQQYFRHDEAL